MKFAVISDIHQDINPWDWNMLSTIPSDISTIVVAGDIDNDVWNTCTWLVQLKQQFETVIWTPGNHDFYNIGFHRTRAVPSRDWAMKWKSPFTVAEIYDHYSRWSIEHGIHFLHRSSVLHNGVTFVGATGWHDYIAGEPYSTDVQISSWKRIIGDSRHIVWERNKIDHMLPLHAAAGDAAAIKQMISQSSGPVVVVTHHLPHRRLTWQKPYDPVWTSLHGSFVNTMFEEINDEKIKYWIYGHTHQRNMTNIGDVCYVCNARGYPDENQNWLPIVLEV